MQLCNPIAVSFTVVCRRRPPPSPIPGADSFVFAQGDRTAHHGRLLILHLRPAQSVPSPYTSTHNKTNPPLPAECIYSKSWHTADATGTGTTPLRTVSTSSDDAKLIFGTVFSLRNMVRKLGGDDDAFVSYRTAQYKLHFYETASSLRLVMLTDTATLSMRNVLHQIYINLWVEYGMFFSSSSEFGLQWIRRWPRWTGVDCGVVVKNPLSPVEHKGGAGVRNELFELGLDQFVRGLM